MEDKKQPAMPLNMDELKEILSIGNSAILGLSEKWRHSFTKGGLTVAELVSMYAGIVGQMSGNDINILIRKIERIEKVIDLIVKNIDLKCDECSRNESCDVKEV